MHLLRSFAVVACLIAASPSFAQNNNGRISGTVTDHTGAVIPGADVTVTNEVTKLVTRAVTDHNGFYVVADLPVGAYRVSV